MKSIQEMAVRMKLTESGVFESFLVSCNLCITGTESCPSQFFVTERSQNILVNIVQTLILSTLWIGKDTIDHVAMDVLSVAGRYLICAISIG